MSETGAKPDANSLPVTRLARKENKEGRGQDWDLPEAKDALETKIAKLRKIWNGMESSSGGMLGKDLVLKRQDNYHKLVEAIVLDKDAAELTSALLEEKLEEVALNEGFGIMAYNRLKTYLTGRVAPGGITALPYDWSRPILSKIEGTRPETPHNPRPQPKDYIRTVAPATRHRRLQRVKEESPEKNELICRD